MDAWAIGSWWIWAMTSLGSKVQLVDPDDPAWWTRTIRPVLREAKGEFLDIRGALALFNYING